MTGKGKRAEERFEAYWKSLGKWAYCYRLPDAADINGLNKAKGRVRDFAKPADYIITYNKMTIFAEVKSTQEKYRFKKSLIRPAQCAAAYQVTAAGGMYFFFIYTSFNRVYAVPAPFVLNYNGPSIPFTDLEQFRWECLESI